jgi:hypothetical protein
MSEILFIAVPGGRIGADRALIQVVVVPRLTGPWAEAGMADWAHDVGQATLPVEQVVAGQLDTVPVTRLSVPDVDLWRSTFPAGTLLRAFAATEYDAPAVTPTAQHADAIGTTYEESAKAIAGAPGAGSGDDEIRRQLQEHWQDTAGPVTPERTSEPIFVTPDFHETISLLREHPTVLAELGLILELSVPLGALGAGVGAIRVRWPENPLVVSPLTEYERSGGSFLPASRGDIVAGMVDLTRPHWATSTVDIDGAVGRLQATAEAVAAGAPPTLPTLRSGGVALLRKGRQEVFEHRRTAAARTPITSQTAFGADQLVLGYRVDVREQGGGWRSLSSRQATYRLNGRPVGAPNRVEEGHIKANAMTSNGPGGVLQATETVARWSGWSLVVPQPSLNGAGSATGPRLPLPFNFQYGFEAEPGSLPKLRFSHPYQLRVRVADLAGGGHALDDSAGDDFATEFVTYRRFEPVGPPVLAPPDGGPDPGATPDTFVLRSDRGVSVADFAAQNPRYPRTADRALTPPRVALAIAEQHGALDDVEDDGFALVRRTLDEGSLPDPAAQGVVLFGRAEPGAVGAGARVDQSWSGRWPDLAQKRLRLIEAAAGKPTLAWEGEVGAEVGVVRLPQAGQLTLEVSSLIEPNHVDHFEISHWLRELTDPAISGGRHPMATPARLVHFVHAVRKPLSDPAGSLTARRGRGETAVVLEPSTVEIELGLEPSSTVQLELGVDPSSTVQLELAAAWEEWGDFKDSEGHHKDSVPRTDVIPPVTVPLGASSLPQLRHEFGDTKHRRITYTATAVSRFRQFFTADENEQAFLAKGVLPEVRVLSSARPPRPVVRSVTPSFRWSGLEVPAGWTRLERVRRGGGLRMELDHPWFATGQGEQLTALVFAGPALPARGVLVTRAGRDPIWPTTAVQGIPRPDAFAGESGPRFTSGDIVAVPYDVWFANDHWYADVEAPGIAGASYSPFLRLAVARYQADSLDGLRLSEPVAAEPVQLLPDRTLTLTREAGALTAQLAGIGPDGSAPNTVEVSIERADAPHAQFTRLADPGDVPGWSRIGGASGILGAAISLPLPTEGSTHRIVIREVETLATDAPPPATNPELTQRTIFLDIIPLT